MIPIAAALLALAAMQDAPSPPPPQTSPWTVQEVIVRAPAPRLWKLSRGGSTVYVLGTIEPMRRDLVWNKAQIARIMAKANRFIIEPRSYTNPIGNFQAGMQALLPPHQTLDDELPDDLRDRLHALLQRIGQSPEVLNRDKAGFAAIQLNFRFRSSPFVTAEEPLATMKALAQRNHVPIEEAGHYDMTPELKEITTIPEDKGIELLRRAVDAAEYQLAHCADISTAWAAGDLHALTAARGHAPDATPNALFRRGAVTTDAAAAVRGREDLLAAIHQALARPGVSITILNLNALAAKGGAIDRLRAEGVEVTEPEE